MNYKPPPPGKKKKEKTTIFGRTDTGGPGQVLGKTNYGEPSVQPLLQAILNNWGLLNKLHT